MGGEVFIGTGGWGYFSGGLPAYAKAFRFVEVNTTFYRHPRLSDVARWRRSVPPSFKFSVKAPRQITHSGGRIDEPEARENLTRAATICSHLRAPWLVLEYPARREFDESSCKQLTDLLSSVRTATTVCVEARAYKGRELPPELSSVLRDIGAVDVVDPLIQEPRVSSDKAYMRIFGKGQHNIYQPTDEELDDVDERLTRGEFKSMIFTFHGVRMYKDATRFSAYKKTGKFPKVTRSEGLSSLDEVLREDARFPSSKEELIRHQGWKLIDLTEEKRVKASALLKQLDEGVYRSSGEVIDALRPMGTGNHL